MEELETAVLSNLGALMALGPLAPFLFEVCLRWHTGLVGQIENDRGYNFLAPLWKVPFELKRLEQYGEAEPGRAGFIAQQGALLAGERPVLGEFIWMPILLHRLQTLLARSQERQGILASQR